MPRQQHRRPSGAAADVSGNYRKLGHQLEHRGPGQGSAPQHVGRGKTLAEQIGPLGKLVGQRPEHGLEIAIRRHRLRRRLALGGAIDDGGFEARGVKHHPAQIGAAQRIAERRGEPGLREEIGQIKEDRDLFGDEGIAMLQRRHLSHRVDREVFGPALFAGLHVEHAQLVGGAQLFEQGQGAG